MANSYYYSNTAAETTLSGSISAGATSIQVAAVTGFPTSYPYVLAVDYGAAAEELVSVTAAAATTLTVTRGFSGTSAQSHSLGAVVRHVVNAQDLTDFRTHEAAIGAVHGLTGDIVGTSDVQTMANKTLTSPVVNSGTFAGGALSGTFTGTPTLSATATVSGTLTSSGGTLAGTWAGTPTFSGSPVTFSGQLDTASGARIVQNSTATGALIYSSFIAADTNDRFQIKSGGDMYWGSGSSVQDTNLYRSAANTLKTDDSLVVVGDLTCSNLTSSNVATLNTLNVTTLTPGSTTISSGSFLSASTGWSVHVASAGVLKAGFVTLNVYLTRSGADITVDAAGALSTGIIQMGTINGVYAPNSALGTLYMHAGNSLGTGTVRTGSTGVVELVRWQASQTISTGHTISSTFTYPL